MQSSYLLCQNWVEVEAYEISSTRGCIILSCPKSQLQVSCREEFTGLTSNDHGQMLIATISNTPDY